MNAIRRPPRQPTTAHHLPPPGAGHKATRGHPSGRPVHCRRPPHTFPSEHSSATNLPVPCFQKAATPLPLPHTVNHNRRRPSPSPDLALRAPFSRVFRCTRVAPEPPALVRAAWAARTAPRRRQPPREQTYMSRKGVVRKNPPRARARASIHTHTHARPPASNAPSRGLPVSRPCSQHQDIAARPAPRPPAPLRADRATPSATRYCTGAARPRSHQPTADRLGGKQPRWSRLNLTARHRSWRAATTSGSSTGDASPRPTWRHCHCPARPFLTTRPVGSTAARQIT